MASTTPEMESAAGVEFDAGQAAGAAAVLMRVTTWVVCAYIGFVVTAMLALGIMPGMDVLLLITALGLLFLARGWPLARDWGPFLIILLAWEAQRGIAAGFGQTLPADLVVGIERTLMGGIVPTVELQAAVRQRGVVGPLDIGLSVVYLTHFVYPVIFAVALWLRDRVRFYRFGVTLLVVSFAAFFTFLLVPVAPPRFAVVNGVPLPVTDVMAEVSRSFGWGGFSSMYVHMLGNPLAAFPSMHAAYAVLVLLFLRERSVRAAWLWAPFVGLIWFATVYLGHHYVIDLVAGAIYAVAGYQLVRMPWSQIGARVFRGLGDRLAERG